MITSSPEINFSPHWILSVKTLEYKAASKVIIHVCFVQILNFLKGCQLIQDIQKLSIYEMCPVEGTPNTSRF